MDDVANSDRELFCVLRAQSGSHDALNELLTILQAPLYRYIRNLVKEPSQAEDILQEVFIRIYRKLKWLREPSALRPWAYQIATRESFRYLNRSKRWSHEVTDEELLNSLSYEAPDTTFPSDLVEQLPTLVEKLSPGSRAVIALYYLHEFSLSETAAVLEIPIGTVKSRLAYGLARLRAEVKDLVRSE